MEHCKDKSSTLEMKSIKCNDTNNDSLGDDITQATSGMIESSSCNERSSGCVSGSKLCTIMIKSYDNISLFTQYGKDGRRSLKELLRMSLSLLVASSTTAKETALKGLLYYVHVCTLYIMYMYMYKIIHDYIYTCNITVIVSVHCISRTCTWYTVIICVQCTCMYVHIQDNTCKCIIISRCVLRYDIITWK